MSPSIDDDDLTLPSIFSPERPGPAPGRGPGGDGDGDGDGRHRAAYPASVLPVQASSETSSHSRSKQRLGQYTVLKTLGEGSFGKVKLAVHQVSGQKVALKIISRRKLINRDMAGRVEREIQYLQLLRHPHIIKLYTVITTPSEIIMVLEYAGGELFNYIVTHGKATEDTARRLFQQMIGAVEYCHRHKIVHRDLKPENVLLDDRLNVKIADFGLSNIMTDGNFLKTSCGSPNYAAPEVISGKLYAGPEVDVWSCGVILYVMLCGGLPFDDEYIPALFKKIAQGHYTIPPYVSSGAANLIRRMLVVNAVHRITVHEIRQDAWFLSNLAEYLQPPADDDIDPALDPNKAINPRSLAPGKPLAMQQRIHEDVVGRLGKTMGYAKDDVQDALGKDEPSAIKDAYLIVRENQIMRTTPAFANAEEVQPMLAQSPPAPTSITSALDHRAPAAMAHGSPSMRTLPARPATEVAEVDAQGNDVTSIAILPSSIPAYHRAYMAQRRAGVGGAASTTTPAPAAPPAE
ncbi:MAG: Protein kinase, partial [Phylliscum demangeonii]